MNDEVYLLYEGDEWLSTDKLVLMGVFSNIEHLRDSAYDLISQRCCEHLKDAKANGYDFDNEDDICEDILLELMSRGATQGYSTNYCYQCVELNVLGEI